MVLRRSDITLRRGDDRALRDGLTNHDEQRRCERRRDQLDIVRRRSSSRQRGQTKCGLAPTFRQRMEFDPAASPRCFWHRHGDQRLKLPSPAPDRCGTAQSRTTPDVRCEASAASSSRSPHPADPPEPGVPRTSSCRDRQTPESRSLPQQRFQAKSKAAAGHRPTIYKTSLLRLASFLAPDARPAVARARFRRYLPLRFEPAPHGAATQPDQMD